MFKFHPIVGIVVVNLTIIVTQLMNLINFGPVFIGGIIAVSVILIALIEK